MRRRAALRQRRALADDGTRVIGCAERQNVLKLFTGKNEKRAVKERNAAL